MAAVDSVLTVTGQSKYISVVAQILLKFPKVGQGRMPINIHFHQKKGSNEIM